MSNPDPHERCPYGIGSDHWPGVGKVMEEMSELGTVLGKLIGSGGDRNHWSGDLVQMMRDELADLSAAINFLEEMNSVLVDEPDLRSVGKMDDGASYMGSRETWKLCLFRSWHRGDPPEKWPKPEEFGLPPREKN